MGWKLLHRVESELFAQMIVTTLFKKHRILTQIAGHSMDVLKILPPLVTGEKEIARFVNALDSVLQECRRFPGPIWDFGSQLVKHSLRRKSPKVTSAAEV